ncbi:TRAP transporter small permease [Salinarimonas chemoclinalis]|uniref:TRAP transporter small permease n=1 Tax=Salinarimonas chemoclinalis TaxID=3241599 RepID=UPI0035575460
MLAALKLVDRAVFHIALTLAMVLLVTMACVSFYQVITRFVFERPSTWSEVTSRSLQIWMVYLGLVAAFRTGSLMAVDMLQRLAPRRLQLVVICAVAGLNLGVLAVMFWYGWSMAERVRFQTLAGVDNPFTGGGISIALVYTAIPVGAALSIVAVVARLAEEIDRLRKGASVADAQARARLETEGA